MGPAFETRRCAHRIQRASYPDSGTNSISYQLHITIKLFLDSHPFAHLVSQTRHASLSTCLLPLHLRKQYMNSTIRLASSHRLGKPRNTDSASLVFGDSASLVVHMCDIFIADRLERRASHATSSWRCAPCTGLENPARHCQKKKSVIAISKKIAQKHCNAEISYLAQKMQLCPIKAFTIRARRKTRKNHFRNEQIAPGSIWSIWGAGTS